MWFLGQMPRWGWLDENTVLDALAAQVYGPICSLPRWKRGAYAAAELPALEGTAMLPMPDDDAFEPKGRRHRS
jgi:hypothetical protein